MGMHELKAARSRSPHGDDAINQHDVKWARLDIGHTRHSSGRTQQAQGLPRVRSDRADGAASQWVARHHPAHLPGGGQLMPGGWLSSVIGFIRSHPS